MTPRWYTEVVNMALGMPRPTKHPKNGVYYLNVRVPSDLVAQLCKSHVKKTLRTKDPKVAKERFLVELEALRMQWQAARTVPQAIPHKQLVCPLKSGPP
ncbi:hypothetical protein IE00_13130 [Paracoccus sp. SM22M-07]|nr:hypothetical protein IE00_13130 [Paracoccus sp. SM22M-07]